MGTPFSNTLILRSEGLPDGVTCHSIRSKDDDDGDDDDHDGDNNNNKVQQTWNVKCMIIPVTIGAIGIIKGLKNIQAVPGRRLIYSLQRTGVLGTSHIMRKVPQSET